MLLERKNRTSAFVYSARKMQKISAEDAYLRHFVERKTSAGDGTDAPDMGQFQESVGSVLSGVEGGSGASQFFDASSGTQTAGGQHAFKHFQRQETGTMSKYEHDVAPEALQEMRRTGEHKGKMAFFFYKEQAKTRAEKSWRTWLLRRLRSLTLASSKAAMKKFIPPPMHVDRELEKLKRWTGDQADKFFGAPQMDGREILPQQRTLQQRLETNISVRGLWCCSKLSRRVCARFCTRRRFTSPVVKFSRFLKKGAWQESSRTPLYCRELDTRDPEDLSPPFS